MENLGTQLVNIGIGFVKSGEDFVNESLKNVQKVYDELKEQGEKVETSEVANLREQLTSLISQVKNFEGSTTEKIDQITSELKEQLNAITEDIDKKIPEDLRESVETAITQVKNIFEKKEAVG
ncbi:MAG: hypothetical protein H7A24_01810 [Leptospiraceae bacterium]|nr:hypothetical protein [Leptospiraceae bacterium]MCP5510585.1 hypothetical protein [Leptospiraceae bacterium]